MDQSVSSDRLAEDAIYFPYFDVCVTLDSIEEGAFVGLSACNSEDSLQTIILTKKGLK